MHCGFSLGTSLLATCSHTGECSEKGNKNDKWMERLIYENLHNKICIPGSTEASGEMWSLSTTLWRLWIPQRNMWCLAWYLKLWQGIKGWQMQSVDQRNMRWANLSSPYWQKVALKGNILLPALIPIPISAIVIVSNCVHGFYVSFLFTYTFPEDVKNEIFDYYFLPSTSKA